MGVESSEPNVAEAEDGQAADSVETAVAEAPAEPAVAETVAEPQAEAEVAEPQAEAEVAEPPIATPAAPRDPAVSSWPFLGYGGIWALFAAFTIWRLLEVPAGQPVFESSDYALTVGIGLSLTFAGPLTILAVWLLTPPKSDSGKGPLLYSSLIKGALAMLAGVCLWWAALIIVDQIRLGRIF